MKAYKVVSLTHKQLSLSNLGKYIIRENTSEDSSQGSTNEGSAERLRQLKENFELEELAYLSTCNRVAYIFTSQVEITTDFLQRFFQFVNPLLSEGELYASAELAQVYEGRAAIRHLHEVAASLDSLVIGEREILRQLRQSYESSKLMGLTGDDLRIAFKCIIPAAKKVYTDTQIGQKPVSVVSLAARKLKACNVPATARFVLVGAGETNQLMGKFLKGDGYSNAVVFNRGKDNGEKLAAQLKGRYLPLDQLASFKEGFDVLICCTGANEPIITPEIYAQLQQGDTEPKIIIDLAIPQDVDPAIAAAAFAGGNHSTYIGIEELRGIAEQNLAFRRSELEKAHLLLDDCITDFEMTYNRRQLEKAFSGLPSKVKAIRERAVTQVFSKELEQMDDESREVLHKVMDYMESKFIGLPIATAREAIVEKNRA